MSSAPRRIPHGPELEPLMRCYGYRFTRTGTVVGAPRSEDAADVALASGAGWPVHSLETFTAQDLFDRAVTAASALDEDAVLAAFVAGLGSAPRGRQTAISYGWARYLPTASGELPDCGLPTTSSIDVTETLLRLALGWSWNELPVHYVPDLEAAVVEGLPEPDDSDRERLGALIDLICSVPEGTTPGQLEKEMAQAKIVPCTDKYQRYGILIGLAEIGVLPTDSVPPSWERFVPVAELHAASRGPSRSDITLPLATWRGGVDDHLARELLEL